MWTAQKSKTMTLTLPTVHIPLSIAVCSGLVIFIGVFVQSVLGCFVIVFMFMLCSVVVGGVFLCCIVEMVFFCFIVCCFHIG
jgi:hypothetical protein